MSKTVRGLVAALAALAVGGLGSATAEGSVGAGLWPSSQQGAGTAATCNPFFVDTHQFCWINEYGSGVELGVKFTSSKAVNVTGVRVYRVDDGAVTGSLWAADGSRLAGPVSLSGAETHGWQDVAFTTPVAITPGQTYLASYLAPSTVYAFAWDYFTSSAYTAGPITASQSVGGDTNGVYCYTYQSCGGFPTNSNRDTNYWVSPLWAYKFTGFFQPVDNDPAWNSAKAGSAIPVKFALGGDQGLAILKSGFPTATQVTCPGAATPQDAIEQTVPAGGSSLTYDAATGQYTYIWKTNKTWAGKCYRFDLGLNDDTSHTFNVALK